MSQEPRVWLITGASQGLGRDLVLSALAKNDRVIATARDISKVQDLEKLYNTQDVDVVRAMQLDVTISEEELRQKAKEAYTIWGRLDVLVNNAGVGMASISEEMGFDGYMKQFKTNFFSPMNVTHSFLPYMRQQRHGSIVFVGSRSSWRAKLPLIGPYASSKAALAAAAEALKVELAPFGIRVLTVLPGSIRTGNWVNMIVMPPGPGVASSEPDSAIGGKKRTTQRENNDKQTEFDQDEVEEGRIPDYAPLRASTLTWMYAQDGTQLGDPAKTAQAIVDVVLGEGLASPERSCGSEGEQSDNANGRPPWPDLLVLGKDAELNIRDRCHDVLRCLDDWKDVTRSIAYEE